MLIHNSIHIYRNIFILHACLCRHLHLWEYIYTSGCIYAQIHTYIYKKGRGKATGTHSRSAKEKQVSLSDLSTSMCKTASGMELIPMDA